MVSIGPNALLCNLSKLLLAVRASVFDGSPLLYALYAECMSAVDYSLLLEEVLNTYNALNDLLFQWSSLLFLFQIIVGQGPLFRGLQRVGHLRALIRLLQM